MRLRGYLVVAGLALGSPVAQSYDIETHVEIMTRQAANQSVLQNSTTLSDLGLTTSQQFPNTKGSRRTIRQLLEDGSRFEDETVLDFSLTNPFLTNRPLRHFYNPVTGEGLFGLFMSSPDWALALPGSVSDQERSYWDARKSLFDALTKPLEAQRQAAFGETFQFLGQVVHHLQDMAQPQHVRNDAHLPLTNRSRYERWTNENRGTLPTDFTSIGYDITGQAFTSTFASPRRFWNTLPPQLLSPAQGMGIAEFTNRNFVSDGTNFDKPGLFPSPILDLNKITSATVQELCLNTNPSCPNGFSGRQDKVFFFGNTVRDNFLGPSADKENPRASTFSIFDQDLVARGAQPIFSLNRFNFQAAHEFLIPRAVAYSAGMINYFFRGKIDLVSDDTNPGTFLIKNLGSEPMNGTFSLYYDDANNNRTKIVPPLYNGSIAANGQQPIGTIPDPTTLSPAPKNPGEYMLVFTGDMGEETQAQPGGVVVGAVVGKVVNIRKVLDLGMFAQTIAIDSRGDVVGRSLFAGNDAVLWSSVLGTLPEGPGQIVVTNFNNGAMALDLGTLPGVAFSVPRGISNNGQMIVSAGFGQVGHPDRLLLWTSSAGTQDITSSQLGVGQPAGINDSGVVVGTTGNPVTGGSVAAIWSSTTGTQRLGILPGNFGTQDPRIVPASAYSSGGGVINNAGQVVGTSATNCFPRPIPELNLISFSCEAHAFLWTSVTGMQDLGTLGFSSPTCAGSEARAISSDGRVAGNACLADGSTTAVMWSSAGAIQVLGNFAGASVTAPTGINRQGQVVGVANTAPFTSAFLWKNGVMISLSDLPEFKAAGFAMVLTATGINDAGQITGVALDQGGTGHAFVYTPGGTSQ